MIKTKNKRLDRFIINYMGNKYRETKKYLYNLNINIPRFTRTHPLWERIKKKQYQTTQCTPTNLWNTKRINYHRLYMVHHLYPDLGWFYKYPISLRL